MAIKIKPTLNKAIIELILKPNLPIIDPLHHFWDLPPLLGHFADPRPLLQQRSFERPILFRGDVR
jgi:hypothetical protein